jgi:hypothetical protein
MTVRATTAFLDLDGVLVDFVSGACHLHNQPYPFNKPENFGNYWVEKMFGITTEEFFAGMDEEWWAELQPMFDWQAVLSVVEKYFGDNICILTSPTNNHGCLEGKRRWIEKWLPKYRRKFLIGPPKEMCAGPGKVLVEDADEKVEKFRKAGGNAILLPRPWNSSFAIADTVSPAEYLEQQLMSLATV